MKMSNELKRFIEKYITMLEAPVVDWEAFFKNAVLERVDFDELEKLLDAGEFTYDKRPFYICSELSRYLRN